MSSQSLQYIDALEDEIALEGLDGITLEALWTRLKQRPNFEASMPIDENSKAFLWSLVAEDSEISLYSLPTPRDKLIIFNRYEHMDPELGIVLEPETEPNDIYPFCPVDDEAKCVRGSCKSYHERVDVTDTASTLTLEEANKQYGEQLVLVASQKLRNKALCISACIDRFYDLTITQYIILERIGRSRCMGEITQGKVSLATMGDNPKSMFYHRKRLLKLNLITKQPHQQKGHKGQTYNGSLLHLTRFYVERRSKFIMMIQRAVEILQTKPGYCAPYTTVKEEMGMPETSCRKLFKSSEFQRYIKNVTAPFRRVYPDASPAQWRCKGKDAEKFVRIMELINPKIDPADVCKAEEAADDDEEDDDSYPGILDQRRIVWGVGLLQQAYKVVEEAGPEGVSQSDMARLLGQTKLDSRTICRNLQRRNTVHSLMKDVGRQRVSRYVSHKYARTGHLTQEFRKERQRMMAMMEANKKQALAPSDSNEHEVSRILTSNSLEGVEVDLEMLTTGRMNIPKSKATDLATCMKVVEETQKKRLSEEEGDNKNQGFLRLLEEIRLTYNNQKRNSPHVTTRMMKRANMIIETVGSVKVIDDAFKLQKMIVQAETEEGYAVKMDKKSLNRLLDKLSKGGFLKNIIVKLKCNNMVKLVQFVVHPSITFESPHLKSAIELQKLKFLASAPEAKREGDSASGKPGQDGAKAKTKGESSVAKMVGKAMAEDSEQMNKTSVGASMQELKQMHQVSAAIPSAGAETGTTTTTKKEAGVKGSLGPKFVRMCELHKLLFYLVYGYSGKEDTDQVEAWQTIASASPEAQIHNEDLSTYPYIYYPELSWKMFIPPLPNHMNSENGWAFVCDVLLRLPLCIFVRLVSICHYSGEIDAFLSHPIKRNLLVKYLPPLLRQSLLQGRRYVTYVIDLINRLCYVGLLQYGHQIMKEKDQVFIYVNRRASLIDTTTSGPGYHQISADKEYVRKEYFFSCMQDILQYWYDMWTISMHTPLGGHNCMQGKKITIQILDRKPQIMESLTPRSTQEAPARDNGDVPGDGRGAGGLDSAMFAHLKRNWSSNSGHSASARPSALLPPNTESGERSTYEGTISYTQYLMNTTNPSSDNVSPKHRLAGLRNVKLSVYKPRMGTDGKTLEIPVGMVPRTPRGRKRKRETPQETEAPTVKLKRSGKQGKSNKPASYQRELKMRKKSPKKPYYDEEDRAALRRMNKLRVDWSSAEDSFLLLCKVASCFLFPNVRSQMITFSLVRDMLHERFPESLNKTSRACQRRINYIMKNPTTEDNVAIFLEEVRQDPAIVADFKSPRVPRNKKNIESVYATLFRSLMQRLVIKFASSESRQCPDLPDTIEEFHERFRIIMASSSLRSKLKFKPVNNISDIDFHVVNTLIYSSLCSKHDRDSYAYQLYLAYQQYPQALLNAVLTRMRQDQMISYKKCYNRSTVAQACLPLSTSPFQLSVTYHHVFNFKYQYEIYGQAWEMLKQLTMKKHKAIFEKKHNKNPSEVQLTKRNKSNSAEQPSTSEEVVGDMEIDEDVQEEGVPVVILHEGGYCATIVALLATKRLIFDIIIPEQIIMMDQQQRVMEDQHQSLLKRFSSHSQMAGKEPSDSLGLEAVPSDRKNDSPIGMKGTVAVKEGTNAAEEDVDDNTSVIGKGKRKTCPEEKESSKKLRFTDKEEISSLKPQEEKATENYSETFNKPANVKSKFTEFSEDSVEARNDEEEPDENTLQSNEDSNPAGDASSIEGDEIDSNSTAQAKSQATASRLGLYMMRDQLTQAEVDQINIQHAQEHLVVNACDITIRLRAPPHLQDQVDAAIAQGDMEAVDNLLLPIPMAVVTEALEKRKKVTLEAWSTIEQVITQWREQGEEEEFLEYVGEVFNYIHSCKEVGASICELKKRFASQYPWGISSLLPRMENAQLILRVGVALVRWVTMAYTKPWLIHTNKITRGNRQSVKIQGVYKMNLNEPGKEVEADKANTESKETESESTNVIDLQNSEQADVTQASSDPSAEDHPQDQESSCPGDSVADSADLPIREDSDDLPAREDSADLPVREDSADLPVREDSADLPVREDSADLPVGEDSADLPVREGSADLPVREGSADLPVREGSADLPVREDSCIDVQDDASLPREAEQIVDDNAVFETVPESSSVNEETALESRRSERISLRSENETGEQAEADLPSVRHIHSSMAMRKRKYRKDEEVSREMEKTIKHHHDASDYEQINVAVRPWVRLNGTLNRRVLDRLLGAVLNLVMERPGISSRDIVCRFSPALQPAHTHDLLDTLAQIECIVPMQLHRSHKPSLFSDIVDYTLTPAELYDCDDDVLYEPMVDAILKLSMFIGDKKYSTDFLSGERR